MSELLLDEIAFNPDVEWLLQHLRIKPGTDDADSFATMVDVARNVARPKALCRVGLVSHIGEDRIGINDVILSSRVLRVNLDTAHRAFVFVTTCGVELEEWAARVDGFLERFWADAIMELALSAAIGALKAHIHTAYDPGHLSMMNPGSLDDWPLAEQQALFAVLGDTAHILGVRLTDSFLMRPAKSVSGILFPSSDTFESCQLCPVENCPNRRARHEPSLLHGKYR